MLKHEDDIRRRLTIAEVPEPPADLVHKIKRDIPKHFTSMTAKEVEKKPREASPLWSFWGMSWQLAASILVLLGFTWAIFETYRSEVNEAARIAEAESDTVTVDAFEKKVTSEPEVFRAEGSAPVVKAAESTELDKEQVPATAAAPLAQTAYAPESQAGSRERRDAQAEPPSDDARTTLATSAAPASAQEPPAVTASAPARQARAGLKDEDHVGRVAANEAIAQTAPQPARAAPAPAAPVAESSFAEESAVSRKVEAPRVVFVPGLRNERLVSAELTLDANGKVVEVSLPDERDEGVIEAVRTAAKEWSYAIESVDAAAPTKRTIEVSLKKGN